MGFSLMLLRLHAHTVLLISGLRTGVGSVFCAPATLRDRSINANANLRILIFGRGGSSQHSARHPSASKCWQACAQSFELVTQ
jgi:hypothetical protein